jgi:PPOX class probable FMN-dependent enzyme
MSTSGNHRIRTPEQLRALIGEPHDLARLKVFAELEETAVSFIERSPFLLLATSDAEGRVDVSPKGDPAGFVLIEDRKTLVIPDRPGNKLLFGFENMLVNPHVGVLFMIPGTGETLRVNGTAELLVDPALLQRLSARGKPAQLAIRVAVEECFFHCPKAFMRAELWKPDTWPERQRVSFGKILARRLDRDEAFADAIDANLEERRQDL